MAVYLDTVLAALADGNEPNLELEMEKTEKCTWGTSRRCNRATLEMHLEAEMEWTCMCTSTQFE